MKQIIVLEKSSYSEELTQFIRCLSWNCDHGDTSVWQQQHGRSTWSGVFKGATQSLPKDQQMEGNGLPLKKMPHPNQQIEGKIPGIPKTNLRDRPEVKEEIVVALKKHSQQERR